jgi:hypothetical protein
MIDSSAAKMRMFRGKILFPAEAKPGLRTEFTAD